MHCAMLKRLSKDPCSRIVDMCKAWKGYRTISKIMDVHQSAVKKCVQMEKLWDYNLSTEKWTSTKIHTIKLAQNTQRGKKNPRGSAKDFQTPLAQSL